MQSSHKELRSRCWVEAALAAITGALVFLTFFWHDWFESLGFDPDHHDGTAEWLIVGALLLVSIAFAGAARSEWRRAAAAC